MKEDTAVQHLFDTALGACDRMRDYYPLSLTAYQLGEAVASAKTELAALHAERRTQEPMKECPLCDGDGFGSAGGNCPRCHGGGKVREDEVAHAEDIERRQRLARTFATEFVTGHYHEPSDVEARRIDQLMVVLLAYGAQAYQSLHAERRTQESELNALKDAIAPYRHTPEDAELWQEPRAFVDDVRNMREVGEDNNRLRAQIETLEAERRTAQAEQEFLKDSRDRHADVSLELDQDNQQLKATLARLQRALETALTFHQVTHIHAVLREALAAAGPSQGTEKET